ncbi:MAG: YceI family protein [Gemmatimonadetes bacterium]|nr:YceI family protein [Gemmatimonadota bacterium]
MNANTWTIDGTHSQVEFAVKHMMFTTVRGRFDDFEGTVVLSPNAPERSSVAVEIKTGSIDTQVDARDQHLRSADFFDVEKYPTITFRSRRVEGDLSEPGNAFTIVGDLTLHGVTREVVLNATFDGTGSDPWGNTRAGFSAETTIDRRDFGLTWNQGLETGGVLVGQDVKIQLAVQAVKEQALEVAAD